MNSIPEQSGSPHSPLSADGRQRFQRALQNAESGVSVYHTGHKFHEVFQMKQGRYADLPATKISEMMKSNSLDNAPTQSLLSVVNGILDESIERKNGEIPHRVACLLRKVVQEIERRISTQAEHLRTQNNLFKAREEKYQSRIRVLEALASGTGDENEIAMNQLQQIKTQKSKMEEEKQHEAEDMVKLMKENDKKSHEVEALKQELEKTKIANELQRLQKEKEANDQSNAEIAALKQELEHIKKTYELQRLQLEKEAAIQSNSETAKLRLELEAVKRESEKMRKSNELQLLRIGTEANVTKTRLEEKIKELEQTLSHWKNKARELEAKSESKSQSWSQKELRYKSFISFQFRALQELRFFSKSVQKEILEAQNDYSEEFNSLGKKLLSLGEAAENYHTVLVENRKLFNELQELKGNIRIYCRVRPFLSGQAGKKTVIEYVGDNGELVVANPAKPGKEGFRQFRFNKVFGPASTQAEVFSDTQPLVRSVLDGYNVCIFAYGQTGSGKTYTMTGPSGATEEDWGVNYRALNDLFNISQSRKSSIMYEIGVQMVEVYNEQVRDLLSLDSSQKKLGIVSAAQSNGLAVPDASMYTVTTTADVMELMDIGLRNRATGATALNERSSRSHSILTIHVRGKDLKTSSVLHGNLHLVDLAGSERVDRSEVTGDRLREAQHINKSLSALGDVIFALAQKSPHVPYRNSKLTQLLQSSLGGQAKTLMFVQLNPDATSYMETMSTLKFAERVSGVELGAARSSREGRDVRDLMEQLASLKDTIARKDEEIERLHLHKDVYPQRMPKTLTKKSLLQNEDNFSDHFGDRGSEADSVQSIDDLRHHTESVGDEEYDDRLSDVSVATEGSVDYTRPLEGKRTTSTLEKTRTAPKSPRPLDKLRQAASRTTTLSKASANMSSGLRKTGSSSSLLKSTKRWQ